ncbi:MAG: SDR family NAD(P)-dependent oxidoreductase, partial [Pseudomonadota bacterium]|nr:SDR family NAD(P)-dependent oxidoreductase [Pseudomonadota bacterium]
FGRIDAVVNNAGVGLFSVFETTPMEVMRHVFETNVFGTINVIQAVVPHFRAQGGGTIVNVSSGSGIAPAPLMSIYSASKHAVEGLSEALYHELATQQVMVRLVEPGFVKQTRFVDTTVATSQKAPVPASYEAYVGQIMRAFTDDYPMELATEEQVAAAIYQAASETGERLRYIAGPDTEVQAKARWTTSEDEYMALMRRMFMQRPTLATAG